MEKRCPTDGAELISEGKHWRCPQCALSYRIVGHCLDCQAELERLQACGASNWFCPGCNMLKSRTRVQTRLEAVSSSPSVADPGV